MNNMKAEIIRISGTDPIKCMACGKCTAACPAYDEMDFHPHQFANMVLNNRAEELLASKGIFNCMSCFACMERCPRGVEPARLIEAVRVVAQRVKDGDHLTADAIPAMLDDELPQQAIVSAMRKYMK